MLSHYLFGSVPVAQELRASVSMAALEEDTETEGRLQEAGRKLDSLAESLQALVAKQDALQV